MIGQDFVLTLAPLATIAATVLIVRTVTASARAKRETEALVQLHTRLIEKFGTSKELLDYLQADAGRKMLSPAVIAAATPIRRIIAAAQAGVVLSFVGVGTWSTRTIFTAEGMQVVSFVGIVMLALGLGYIVSSIVAYVMSRRLGLLNGESADPSMQQ
jgi:hypothetical protein